MKCKFLLTGSNGVLSKSKSRRCVTYFCKPAKLFLSVYVGVPKDGHFSCFQRSWQRGLSGSESVYVTFVIVPENSLTYATLAN